VNGSACESDATPPTLHVAREAPWLQDQDVALGHVEYPLGCVADEEALQTGARNRAHHYDG